MPAVYWDRDKRAEFNSPEALEQLIDDLTSTAKDRGMPLGLQIEIHPETSLLITLGHDVSHVGYYSTADRPLAVVCRGPWESDERIEVSFQGEISSPKKRHCVPVADAREAVRRYYQTGTRPDNIDWVL